MVPVGSLLADNKDDEEGSGEDAAPNYTPASEPIPSAERGFGRYSLLRRLAYGGMGEIFLARQGGVGAFAKIVVIKRILSHVKRDEKHRRMFLDEARLQALLNNPHIVQVHDMGEEGGHVYLAMEHVHGPSWRALIDRCKKNREHIPLGHVCGMVAQAARGLSYAHNLLDVTGSPLKIVHRDINPHNMLVTYDGEVKIIDFGIAKSELAAGNTETGTIKGKFSYMSPEQSAAQPLDRRSDIFTLGICLYELAALVNPFRRGNVVLSLEAIQKEDPPPIARRRPEAAPLQAAIDRCLAKERTERFDDAEELALALEGLLASDVFPPVQQPLASWLRERFAGEMAEHMHILEQTGSSGAVVTRGTDPAALRRRPSTSKSGEIVVDSPLADLVMNEPTGETVPGDATTSTPVGGAFDVPSIADAIEPPRRSRALLAGAGAAALLAAGAATAVLLGYADSLLERVELLRKAPPPLLAAPVPLVPPVAAPPPSGPPEQPPTAPVAELPREPEPADTGHPFPSNRRPGPVKPPAPSGKVALATLGVTTEGYAVKGGRKVYAGETTTLSVDDAGAPYQLKVRVRADAAGSVTFDVETEPWAVVRVDGVGKGKTPQRGLPLGHHVELELANPKAGTMHLSLTASAVK